jgi:hypothetical protein
MGTTFWLLLASISSQVHKARSPLTRLCAKGALPPACRVVQGV